MTNRYDKQGESWNTLFSLKNWPPRRQRQHDYPQVVDPRDFNQGSAATEQLWDTQPQRDTTRVLLLEVATKQLGYSLSGPTRIHRVATKQPANTIEQKHIDGQRQSNKQAGQAHESQ
jgi:hypothetical protein